MLYCYFDKNKYYSEILWDYSTGYFDRAQPEWYEDQLVVDILRNIDKSTWLPPRGIMSDVLGARPDSYISGGSKALIQILNMPGALFPSSGMGDNCAPWLQKVTMRVDVNLFVSTNFHFVENQVMYFPQYDRCAIGPSQFRQIMRDNYDDFIRVPD